MSAGNYHGMRYQVRIIAPTSKPRRWRKSRIRPDYNFGSSETLEGAYALLEAAPFWEGERVVLVDQMDGRWVAIKRGRVSK